MEEQLQQAQARVQRLRLESDESTTDREKVWRMGEGMEEGEEMGEGMEEGGEMGEGMEESW